MRKTIVLFIAISIIAGIGNFLASQEKLELEIMKTPTFKEVGGLTYVYMDVTCPRSKMGEMTLKANEILKKQGIKSDWSIMIFYNWPETEEGTLKWMRGLIVPEDTKIEAPLKKEKLDNFKALTYTITENLDGEQIAKGNQLMDDYIKKNGFIHVWPIYEIYRINTLEFHYWYLVKE